MLAILLPAAGILASFALGGRNAERIALGSAPIALAIALAVLAEVLGAGTPDRLRGRGVRAAARHRAEGRRPLGGHAGDERADPSRCRPLRPRWLRHSARRRRERARRSPSGSCSRRSRPRSRSSSSAATCSTSMSRSNSSPSPPCRSPASTAGPRPTPRRCAICCSPCSARSSTCSARRSYTGRSGRSTSRCLPNESGPLPAVTTAAALMTAGLLAKTALFPLHLWLPPAHANAPGAGERGALRPRRQGLVLPGRAALVLCPARAAGDRLRRDPRRARVAPRSCSAA